MGDIEGMFHQVKIPETDVDFLRFLWWPGGDTTQVLREFRIYSVQFHLPAVQIMPSSRRLRIMKVKLITQH
ncbi:hypothetical protein N1851_002960 [Merluccius polli]|uniref:Uncharacterized protein n=1 Tax=Merluccius polli TaxID=89951 RepID=A0AA47PCN7_MERPO|nr:hypothetical protein N1851_002960 [Merluccius polli]